MDDTANVNDTPKHTPPAGDSQQAEKYISRLIQLLNEDRLHVAHTNLAKFDPSALQDHYRLDLKDYNVEVSHSKNPNSGKDSYVILFTNIKNIREGCSEKVILAYMHLTQDQFKRFSFSAMTQEERIRKAEELKKLQEAMVPIDQALESVDSHAIMTTDDRVTSLDTVPSSSINTPFPYVS